MKRYLWLLLLVVILGLTLRMYRLGTIPVSLYWDETAIGYNAYSITETSRDEYGTSWPLIFKSFSDYKLPGYIYLTSVSVKILGLNEFAVRLPSALLGILTVVSTYYLVKELWEVAGRKKFSSKIGLISSLLMAISPWHLQFSRSAFEANGALFFIVLGTYFFLKGRKYDFSFWFSILAFASSTYFYRSVLVFIPMFFGLLCVLFGRNFWKSLLVKIIVLVLIVSPIYYLSFFSGGQIRLNQVSLINNVDQQIYHNIQLSNEAGNTFISKIIYNRRLVYLETFVSGYISHFTADYLFFHGDPNPRHGVENTGILYVWEGIAILIGGVGVYRMSRRVFVFLCAWLALGPLPAALSVPTPHALRSLNMLPAMEILSASGLFFVGRKLRNQKLVSLILGLVIAVFVFKYLISYYIDSPIKRSESWADGYKQLVDYVVPIEDNYGRIVVSGHYWKPYIYFLFYMHYPPGEYQKFGTDQKFGKFIFGDVGWAQGSSELDKTDLKLISGGVRTLVILSPFEYEAQKNNLTKITEIHDSAERLVYIASELKK